MKNRFKQLGQGMTEYIIIVALIAIAAIAVYGIFGDTVRGQVGAMTTELAGGDGDAASLEAEAQGKLDADADTKTLKNYTGNN